MGKTIEDLLVNIEYEILGEVRTDQIESICYDSRKCQEASLFVAIRGYTSDGHDYVQQAVARGAWAVIVEEAMDLADNICQIIVANTRQALAIVAANFYEHPGDKVKIIGVTGTNGKTTSIHCLNAIYQAAGYKTGMIGTIGGQIDGMAFPLSNTTPESYDLQKLLQKMVQAGVDYCMMEVSSHALGLYRVYGLDFHAAIYTNLSPDHLEFHRDMRDYFETKAKLFNQTRGPILVNLDDDWAQTYLDDLQNKPTIAAGKESNPTANFVSYGLESSSQANYFAQNIESDISGISYDLFSQNLQESKVDEKKSQSLAKNIGRLSCPLPGVVNVYNSLAAASLALEDGLSFTDIERGLAQLEAVAGRFQMVYQEDFAVFIDFAHTEDALKNAILTLKNFCQGRLILVFGVYAAPGAAGRSKRLGMGETAANYADYLLITSDNPKFQDPKSIISEVLEGVELALEKPPYQLIIDRQEAIREAIKLAQPGDIVLLAGKGHETSQNIGGKAIPFNEKEIALAAIKSNLSRT